MSWIKLHKAVAIISFAMITATPSAELKAEPVVIKYEGSSGQNYKPGKKLLPAAKITLKSGEVLTILDERGTRTLRGPGTFSASSSLSAGTISNTSLSTLVKTSSVRRARTGAVRGESPPQQTSLNPNLWFVDIGKSAKFCVADFASLQLWRADTTVAQQITATDRIKGGNVTVKFAKGRATARWPSALTAADGGKYSISIPDAAGTIMLDLVKVDVTGEERIDIMASKLLDRGCQAQSELLAATFAQSDPVPAGG